MLLALGAVLYRRRIRPAPPTSPSSEPDKPFGSDEREIPNVASDPPYDAGRLNHAYARAGVTQRSLDSLQRSSVS